MSFIPQDWQPAVAELSGKTILVTGASRGIGRAVALACAQRGAEVLLLGRDEPALENVYDEITAAKLKTPGLIPLDLNSGDPALYETLAGELTAAGVELNGLVHNASVLGERRALAQTSPQSWQEVLQVNMTSVFLLTRALMPLLEAAPSASVILTSSGVGRRGKAYWGAYAVSKFATEGYMQVLADELGSTSSVRVNSLNPGAVNTRMRRLAYPAEPPSTNPEPSELTDRWIYLLSDASCALNGETLRRTGLIRRCGVCRDLTIADLYSPDARGAQALFWRVRRPFSLAGLPSDRRHRHPAGAIPSIAPFSAWRA